MRFNPISLGLVATVFMAVCVRAGGIGDTDFPDVTGDLGNGGVRDTAGDITGGLGDVDLATCIINVDVGCVTDAAASGIDAPVKRASRLSRRKLLRRQGESEKDENELDEDEFDEDELDENDTGKKHKRLAEVDENEVDENEVDENEVDENEIDENEIDENEVEVDEEEADELGDADPTARR